MVKTNRNSHVLALVTDAFGGHGGIALYMRDVLSCIVGWSETIRITLLARHGRETGQIVSDQIDWKRQALHGKISYLGVFFKVLLAKKKPAFIYCGHINLVPLSFLAAVRFRAPIVLSIHGIEAWKPPPSILARRLLKHVDRVISVSEVTRIRFLNWSKIKPEQVRLMPNAIKLDLYGMKPKNPLLVERYRLEGKTVLMTLGRLSTIQRHKGIDEILEVLPELLLKFSNLVYLIAGGGDDITRLERKAGQLGLDEHVVFCGFVPEEEKADHYRIADAFALTGRGDGFGFVLLEAMACGTPVVASVLDGSREAVLEGELGRVVNPDDKQDLVNGISEVLKKERGIPERLDYFSYPRFCNRLFDSMGSYL